MNGYPLLTKLETVIDFMSYQVEDKEAFYYYIGALHDWQKRTITAEIKSRTKK